MRYRSRSVMPSSDAALRVMYRSASCRLADVPRRDRHPCVGQTEVRDRDRPLPGSVPCVFEPLSRRGFHRCRIGTNDVERRRRQRVHREHAAPSLTCRRRAPHARRRRGSVAAARPGPCRRRVRQRVAMTSPVTACAAFDRETDIRCHALDRTREHDAESLVHRELAGRRFVHEFRHTRRPGSG